MPRQTVTGESQNLSPQSRNLGSPSLPVGAPLMVNQKPDTAQLLVDALSSFMPAAQHYKQAKDQRDAAQGATDALTGQRNDSLFNDSPEYHQNYLKQTTQAKFNMFSAKVADDVQSLIDQNPTANVEDVNNLIEQRYREFALGPDGKPSLGMDEASVASVIAPQMAQLRANLVQHAFGQIKDKQDNNFVEAVGINANVDYAKNGSVDWNQIHDSLFKAVGGPKTNQAIAQMATAFALQHHDPSIISSLPTKWSDGTPGIMSTDFGVHLLRAQDQAENQQKTDAAQQIAHQKFTLEKSLYDANRTGTPVTLDQIQQKDQFGRYLLTPQEQLQWVEANSQAQDSAANRDLIKQALAKGDGSVWLLTSSHPGAATKGPAHMLPPITQADIQSVVDQSVASLPPNQQLQAAFHFAQSANVAYTPLKNFLSNPALTSPQSFARQLEAYKVMQATSPGATSLFLDDKAQAVYQIANTLDDGSRSPEQIAQLLAQRDPKQQEHIDTLSKAVHEKLSSVSFGHHWYGAQINPDEVQNMGTLQSALAAKANALIAVAPDHYSSPDEVLNAAAKSVSNDYIIVNGYAVRKTADMPPPDLLQKAWNSWQKNVAPEVLKGTGYNAEDVMLEPDAMTQRDGNSLGLYVKGTLVPASPMRFTYHDLVKAYGVQQTVDVQKAQAEKQKRLQADAELQRHIPLIPPNKI